MNPRICICCGEPMSERGNTRSRNPNLCACCSSLVDGMDESSLPALPQSAAEPPPSGSLRGTEVPVVLGKTPLPALPPFSAS